MHPDVPTDRFALKIQKKVSFKQLRVFDELENCKSSYIVKHFFCQHYYLANKSKYEPRLALKDILTESLYPKDIHLGKVVAIGMEFLDGKNFFDSTESSLYEKFKYTIQVACGLEWLHSRNIIHRNIKPENIIIAKSENIVLYQFFLIF